MSGSPSVHSSGATKAAGSAREGTHEALRRSAEFRAVVTGGVRLSGKRMVLYVVPREQGIRVGFVTGRGVGGAVRRNRARRRLKEALRALSSRMKGGFDIVVAARPGVDRVKTQELREEMEGLLVMGRVIGS